MPQGMFPPEMSKKVRQAGKGNPPPKKPPAGKKKPKK